MDSTYREPEAQDHGADQAERPVLASVVSQSPGDAFLAIFDQAPNGMLLVDAEGRIAAANARLIEMFGYGFDEIVGQTIEMLLPERYRAGHVALRDGYRRAPTMRAMGQGRDLTGRRRDGVELPVEIALNVVDLPGGRMTFVTVVDITERKRAELRLRDANAQLEEFTYVASHDLRSPIRGIATLIDFIREDYGEAAPEAVTRNLERMSTRVAGLEKMIDDLLTYARAGRRTVCAEPIDLAAVVAGVIALCDAPPGFDIVSEVPEIHFLGARTPLETVLRNLVSNAVKHHDRERGRVVIGATIDGSACEIAVSDDGPGIPESAQARIFRLFQTLSASQRQGSGLGLAVVQRLVETHGGSVSVTSHAGSRGTTFRVRWPLFARTDLDATP